MPSNKLLVECLSNFDAAPAMAKFKVSGLPLMYFCLLGARWRYSFCSKVLLPALIHNEAGVLVLAQLALTRTLTKDPPWAESKF